MNKRVQLTHVLGRAFDLVFNHARVVLPATLLLLGLGALVGMFFGLYLFNFQGSIAFLKSIAPHYDQASWIQAWHVFMGDNPYMLRNGLIAYVLFTGFISWLSVGFMHIVTDLNDLGESAVSRLFSGSFVTVLKLLAGVLLLLPVLIPAFILGFFPGLYLSLRLAFFNWLIVDVDAGVFEAMKLSWLMTKGHVWELFAYFVIAMVIVGTVSLNFFALLLTTPLSVALYFAMYRQLRDQLPLIESVSSQE